VNDGYAYPGDEPAAVLSANAVLGRVHRGLGEYGRVIGAGRTQLDEIWPPDAQQKVNAELGQLDETARELQSQIESVRAAVARYESVLADVRGVVDSLRKQRQNLSEALAGEEYAVGRAAASPTTATTPTPTRTATPGALAEDSVTAIRTLDRTSHRLAELHDEYGRAVRRAAEAAAECRAILAQCAAAVGRLHDPNGKEPTAHLSTGDTQNN
jgi:prefoldin subunit 5